MPRPAHPISKYFKPDEDPADQILEELFGVCTDSDEYEWDPLAYQAPKEDTVYLAKLRAEAEASRRRAAVERLERSARASRLNVIRSIYGEKLCVVDPLRHANMETWSARKLLCRIGPK